MKRHFYISNDLNDLEVLEKDLAEQGISRAQTHILSDDDAALEKHHLHPVLSIFKKDVVYSSKIGFLIGLSAFLVVIVLALLVGIPEPYLWVPVIFLALFLLGFCTWEGGLIGIQKPNHHYTKFEKVLRHGKHLVIVDVAPEEIETLRKVMKAHPRVHFAGHGEDIPDWVVGLQEGI